MDYKRKRSLVNYFSKLDIRVFLAFIILILFSLSLFWFQFYKHEDCGEIDFTIEAQKKQVNEAIEFRDKTPNAKSWKWDFGDNSEKVSDKSPLHKYKKAGIYTVTLRVNGTCTLQKIIEIRDLGKIIDPMKIPEIVVPTVVTVGQPVEFYYNYRGQSFSWEWSFGETGQMDNTSEFPAYVYSTPGIKKVTLIINGDVAHMTSKDVYVKPRKLTTTKTDTIRSYVYEKDPNLFNLPEGSPQKDPLDEFLKDIPGVPLVTSPVQDKIKKLEEEKSKTPEVSQNQFELLLLDVAKQSKTKEDFSQYTCGNYEFPVVKNNKEIIPFSEFCEKIKDKKIKIEALRLTKDNRNCIQGITINYKVRKALIWVHD